VKDRRKQPVETKDGQTERPTLKTIAYMTGLGVTTVSRALKNAPDISQATRERVQLIARQIGYRPNRAGVRLRTGKTNVIALVLNTQEEIMGLTSHIIFGISERLRDTPYHLVVTPYSHANDPMDPIRYIVETGSADGVIFSRTQRDDPRVRYLRAQGFPFASHGRTKMGIEHPYHDFDNDAFAFQAVAALAARGRKRLALVTPPPSLTYHDYMVEGFQRGVIRHGLASVPLLGADVDSSLKQTRETMGKLMAMPGRPDGIVCGSGSAAIAVIAGCEDLGLELGRDYDIAAKQFLDVLQWMRPGIIAYHEDIRLAGSALADAVIGAIEGRPVSELQSLSLPAPYDPRQTEKSAVPVLASSRTA
jgi:LacI family transcriptional regulator